MYFTDSRKERSHGKARSNGLVMDWGIGEQGASRKGAEVGRGFQGYGGKSAISLTEW